VDPEQEGWYTDPFGRHEARWMSKGVPTKLVRDGKEESYDDPPDSPPSQAWLPIQPPPGSFTPLDTLRADGLEAERMPSLAELNRRERGAALTAEAHPWFIARHWIPTLPTAKPISAVGKAALIGGGVVAGLLALISIYLGVVQLISMLSQSPPAWGWLPFGLLITLAAPGGTYLIWRADRRGRVPVALRIQRAETSAGLIAILVILVVIVGTLPLV
jgi:hypothetical protein